MADGDADVKILKEAYLSVAPFNAEVRQKNQQIILLKH